MANDELQKIKLDIYYGWGYHYCTFNLKGEFITYYKDNIIFIYSTQTKNNKWNCKRIYKIPESFLEFEDFKFIGITKYDKLYLFSNNSVYESDLITEKSNKILIIKEEIKYDDIELISSNENFICLKIKDKIIIYSDELKTCIVSLDINNGNVL
jgi:hypothetical protein